LILSSLGGYHAFCVDFVYYLDILSFRTLHSEAEGDPKSMFLLFI
jgi:hypothetical protein